MPPLSFLFYNFSVRLSRVFLKCHIFSLVYGCVFIPAEWAPITRFQRLWQQPSVRKPNTSQLRQCTQADVHTHTHTHTNACTHSFKYTQTHWHNTHRRDERANLSNHQLRQARGRIVSALVCRKRTGCASLSVFVCNFLWLSLTVKSFS